MVTFNSGSTPPNLESESTYQRLDLSGVRNRLSSLPLQCRDSWQQAGKLTPPANWAGVDRVIIGGMGGSAMAGDLLADFAAHQGAMPVTVIRDFNLPFHLNRSSLFIACSHSGTTEETLSVFRQARRQDAPILAITSGGVLEQEATSAGISVMTISAPGEPRSAVGYNLMLLLGALSRCGLLEVGQPEIEAAITASQSQVSSLAEDVPEQDNAAKQIARQLMGRMVIVYGGGLFSGMARRWKTQLNENAKAWAFYETIPELLHNSVEAFGAPGASSQDKTVLVLKPATDSKELERRYKVVSQLLSQQNIPHRIVEATSGPALSQQLSMLVLGDYVSYYLSILQGLDPSPTPVLNLGKELLNEA